MEERNRFLELLSAAKALAKKMKKIENESNLKDVFINAHVHGCSYNGESWKEELNALEAVLQKTNKL